MTGNKINVGKLNTTTNIESIRRSEDFKSLRNSERPKTRWQAISFTSKNETAPERKAFIDQIKMDLCQKIRRVALRERYTQKELAIKLGTSESRVSKVVKGRTEHLTIDILFNYLHIIEPRTKVLIAI